MRRRTSLLAFAIAGGGCLTAAPQRKRAAHAVAIARSSAVTVSAPSPVSASVSVSVSVSVAVSASDSASGSPDTETTTDTATITAAPAISGPAAIAYGALSGDDCIALLVSRKIPFAVVSSARGVDRPVRFTGKLHGVDLHGGEPIDQRTTSPTEIVDCRLALALDDFAVILAAHGIKEALHFAIYRAPPGGTPADAVLIDHPAGLAIDLAALIESDGSRTGVFEDWKGGIGTKTCGKWAGPKPVTKRGQRLRAILCETAAAQMFHLVLTPNFNDAHKDHFHLEVKRGAAWFFVK